MVLRQNGFPKRSVWQNYFAGIYNILRVSSRRGPNMNKIPTFVETIKHALFISFAMRMRHERRMGDVMVALCQIRSWYETKLILCTAHGRIRY